MTVTDQHRLLKWFRLVPIVALASVVMLVPRAVKAASLLLSPAGGSFTVGSTFDVSLVVDTGNESINAIGTTLSFPPDRLQLVSPVIVGQSIIEVWSAQPRFNNQTGQVTLQGGIPGGINASRGLITTLRFRVKSVGTALVKIQDDSRVLLNDGRGTDVLRDRSSGIYELVLPPPEGPIVVSESHTDQSKWYSNRNVILSWAAEPEVEGYSYIMSDEPGELVDDIVETSRNAVTYKSVADGVHYFHIKALRKGSWGGDTHFAVKVDGTPPADFPVDITPGARTTRRQPLIGFATTDGLSGVSHYEIKLVPLKLTEAADAAMAGNGLESLFIETQSPYLPPELALGTYHVIVRAYDGAGNYREVTQRLAIVRGVFQFVENRGLEIRNTVVITWPWLWAITALLTAALAYAAWRVRQWHRRVELQKLQTHLPDALQQQLQELKTYREKYGKITAVLLALVVGLGMFAQVVSAQQIAELSPPIVSVVSRDISNEEIFYVGGKTEIPATDVAIYLQSLQSGETSSQTATADKRGEWFYRHNTFLPSGGYLLWVQGRLGNLQSPPSSQVQINVQPTAIQLGASRLSFETIYLVTTLTLLAVLLGVLLYLVFHTYHGRKKHAAFMKEVREAEESVRRGFAVLRRDIEAELAVIHRAKLSKELSAEEHAKEEQLMKDLSWVEKYIGKEIWDVERVDSAG